MRSIPCSALLLLLAGTPALAAVPKTVAIAADTGTLNAKVADEVQDGITAEVLSGLGEVFSSLAKTKVELVPTADPPVLAQVRTCDGAECLADVAKSAKVDLVVQIKVQPKKATKRAKVDCTLAMIVARAVPERDSWREKSECQACTSGDIKHMASLLGATIAERIDIAPPAPTRVAHRPVPIRPPASAQASLAAAPPPKPAWSVPRLLSIATILGGTVILSSGIYLLSLDGRGTCGGPWERQCPRLYSTTGLSTGLIVGGSAVALAGLVGLIWFSPHDGDGRVSLGVTPSSLSLRGSF